MKRFNLFIAMLVLTTSCLTAQEKKENVAVLDEFVGGIDVSGAVSIRLIQTASFYGISNNPNVEFDILSGILYIKPKQAEDNRKNNIQTEVVDVYFAELTSLWLSDVARAVTAKGTKIGYALPLRITLSDAAEATLAINNCENIDATLGDAARLTLSGSVDVLNVTASGAATVMTEDVKINELSLRLSDAARVLTSAEKATGRIADVSLLNLLNENANSTVEVSDMATIKKNNETIRSEIFDYQAKKRSEMFDHQAQRREQQAKRRNEMLDQQAQRRDQQAKRRSEMLINLAKESDDVYFNLDTNTRSITIKYQDTEKKKEQKKCNSNKSHDVYVTFGLGFNSYGQDFFRHTLPRGYENMELSPNISQTYHFDINYDVRMGHSGFYANFGLGIGWNIYKFLNEEMIPGKDKEKEVFVLNPYAGVQDRSYKKSKLQSSWLRIPVGLKYQSRQKLYVYAGITGGVKLGSSSKQVYNHFDTGKERVKSHNDFYLSSLRADLEVRVGYRGIGIFATYGLTDMFLKNHGPQLTPFSFGIIL